MTAINYILHYLHIVCAAFWLGSLLYTELILWPQLKALGELEKLQGALRRVRVRQMIGVFVVGTIVTGIARGIASGALDRLHSLYGILFMTSAVVGVFMMTWWISFPSRALRIGWRVFYASFWVVLALMVGMRFAS
jgi:putative copper export protein